MPAMERSVDAFAAERPRLVGLAYRLVGSVADAEDLVQEAHVRFWQQGGDVRHPGAFLTRVVVNLAIDHMRSARVRREEYIGHWLPEPVSTTDGIAFGAPVSRHDIAFGLLVVLERLSPLERAVYVLSELFDEKPAEIAVIVARTPEAVRQLLHRARSHMATERPRHEVSEDGHAALVAAFFGAVATGDVTVVETFLQEGVTVTSDGGGRPGTATRIIEGLTAVARFFIGIASKQPASASFAMRSINGDAAVVGTMGGVVDSIVVVEGDGMRIGHICLLRNPLKLQAILPLS